MNYYLRLMGELPMPPADADFSLKIDFKKGEGNPRRVFDAASAIIDAFEVLDKALIDSIDTEIEPIMVLEDLDAGSLRVFLRNVLKRIDDGALKTLEWKPIVGKYLVRSKYLVLEFLDESRPEHRPTLGSLKDGLQRLAQETDVRQLPDYPPIHEGRLVAALDKVQNAKGELDRDDKLTIESEGRIYEVNLASQWEPSESIVPSDTKSTTSHGELILTIRKPDFIKDTMWQFTLGKNTISAPIHDAAWLGQFHSRVIHIAPGDALRCVVTFTYIYDDKGALIDQKIDIDHVLEIISGSGPQPLLLPS